MSWLFKILIMSCLFKDPVVIIKELYPDCLRIQLTVVWLNFDRPNQTVKNGLKVRFPQINFFLKKQLKLSCTYWPLLFCKVISANPELWGCAIFGSKMARLFWTKFFGGNHYCYFHPSIGPFHSTKFFKKFTACAELSGWAIFGPKMVHLPKWVYKF